MSDTPSPDPRDLLRHVLVRKVRVKQEWSVLFKDDHHRMRCPSEQTARMIADFHKHRPLKVQTRVVSLWLDPPS